MLMSWVFSLAYASVCAYAYACAYALVKTSLNTMKIEKLITQPSVLIQECSHKNLTFPVFWRVMVTVATSVDHELYS